MAFLKKIKLSDRLKQLSAPEIKKAPPLILFGSIRTDNLFTANQRITNMNHNLRYEILQFESQLNSFKRGSMAANQFGFIFRYVSLKTAEKTEILINPIVRKGDQLRGEWEVCPCFPFMKTFIHRFESIEVEFYDKEMNEQQIQISGREARELQQSLDYLNGFTMLDCRISRGDWDVTVKGIPKIQKALDFYSLEVKKLIQNHSDLFKQRTIEQINNQRRDDMEEFCFESMMIQRLKRYARRELSFMADEEDQLLEKLKG